LSHQKSAVRDEDNELTIQKQQKNSHSNIFVNLDSDDSELKERNSQIIQDELSKNVVPEIKDTVKNSTSSIITIPNFITFFDKIKMTIPKTGLGHILIKHGHDFPGFENDLIPPEKTGLKVNPQYPKAHFRTKTNKDTLSRFELVYQQMASQQNLNVFTKVTMKGCTTARIYVDPDTLIALGGPWSKKLDDYVVSVAYHPLSENQYEKLKTENTLM